ncbi:MAG: hypothetical protein AB7G17_09635 [Phycisphaerales bacterium]
MARAIGNVGMAALAAAALAGSAGTANSAEMRCEWVGQPQITITYGPWRLIEDGFIWDTWKRTCTKTATGQAIWLTTVLLRSCTGSVGAEVGTSGGSVSAGASYTWTETILNQEQGQATGSTSWEETSCPWSGQQPQVANPNAGWTGIQDAIEQGVGGADGPGPMIFPVVHASNVILKNTFYGAMVTFDGVPVPPGGTIRLSDYPLGPHVYAVTPIGPPAPPVGAFKFHITVVPSPVITEGARLHDQVPRRKMDFTNTTGDPVHAFFTVTPIDPGLEAIVLFNERDVLPGETITLEVEFYTAPGYVMTACQDFSAVLDAHANNQFGEAIASGIARGRALPTGDSNEDYRVDFLDLNNVLGNFGVAGPGLLGDVNGDGVVNFLDLNSVLSSFGVDCSGA